MIGKAGLLSTVPFVGAPMAAVLRQVENVVDVSSIRLFPISVRTPPLTCLQTIAFSLIDLVESRTKDLEADAKSLDGSLETCIKAYDGITSGITKRSLRYARREIAA